MFFFFFFQAEDGIRDLVRSRGLGDVYKRQVRDTAFIALPGNVAGRTRLSTYRHNDENAPVGSYLSLIHI